MKKRTIVFVASRSGGHILPCQALAEREKKADGRCRAVLLTGSSTIDLRVAKESNVFDEIVFLPEQAARSGVRIVLLLTLFFNSIRLFFIALKKMVVQRPEKIVSTGGFIAVPACSAAWIARVPIELYELNAEPGKAVAFLAPLASKIYVCFDAAWAFFPSKKTSIATYPIRSELTSVDKLEARKELRLSKSSPTIFILGGSQGSFFLNAAWKKVVESDFEWLRHVQVIHQTGADTSFDWNLFYHQKNIRAHTFSFSDHISYCYSAADVVICRAGAGTLFELEKYLIPYITIPLAARINGHQIKNAKAMVAQSQYAHFLEQEAIEKEPLLLAKSLKAVLYAGHPSGFVSNEYT